MKKVVLAYSGGLDTSVIAKWLSEKGYEVHGYVADVGQQEEFEAVQAKATAIGLASCKVDRLVESLVEDYAFAFLRSGGKYEGRYLLGTALARPIIAEGQIAYAREIGATAVSHGATGKGNDQVRFELAYLTLAPELEIISPWKDPEFLTEFDGRMAMLEYAKNAGIPIQGATNKPPFSIDENVLHISYEGGVLESLTEKPPAETYGLVAVAEEVTSEPAIVTIEFSEGTPVKLIETQSGSEYTAPLEIVQQLNVLAGERGIGRIDIVENRFVGIKSRGIYESPAMTVLLDAFIDLQTITQDKAVTRICERVKADYLDAIYNGMWFSPERQLLTQLFDSAAKVVSGTVSLELSAFNTRVIGRAVNKALYQENLASMDESGGYDQADAKGFIRVQSTRLKRFAEVEAE